MCVEFGEVFPQSILISEWKSIDPLERVEHDI